MQILNKIQKNLFKVVVFNRIFSVSILLSLFIYCFQVSFSTNLITLVLLSFSFVLLVFHTLLIEIIGQLITKKAILTNETCDWLAKVVGVSYTILVTGIVLTTGNLFFASFYTVPLTVSTFLVDTRISKISIFSILFVLIISHIGILNSTLLVNNIVNYAPSGIILALSILSIAILGQNILNTSKNVSQKNNILQSMATTDVLTGLINRRYFDRRITEEIARSKRHNSNLTLALFDIDHFKKINDNYGHTVGDKILKELGDIILSNTRECDISARYGGEEFALILPETTQIEAAELLERLRQLIEAHTFLVNNLPIVVTVSVGIAQYEPEYSSKDFIDQADAALYQAKSTGRNKVVYGIFTTPKLCLPKY